MDEVDEVSDCRRVDFLALAPFHRGLRVDEVDEVSVPLCLLDLLSLTCLRGLLAQHLDLIRGIRVTVGCLFYFKLPLCADVHAIPLAPARLDLLHRPPAMLLEIPASMYGAVGRLALLMVHLQQPPQSAAPPAPAGRRRARHPVLERVLHLGAAERAAVGQLARCRVDQYRTPSFVDFDFSPIHLLTIATDLNSADFEPDRGAVDAVRIRPPRWKRSTLSLSSCS